MKTLSLAASEMAILTWLASTPVAAQQRAMEPLPQLHAVNPSLSLSAPANTPLQEQMREDYAASLKGAQRELLQQNPSGLGRQELAIGRELNSYTGPQWVYRRRAGSGLDHSVEPYSAPARSGRLFLRFDEHECGTYHTRAGRRSYWPYIDVGQVTPLEECDADFDFAHCLGGRSRARSACVSPAK